MFRPEGPNLSGTENIPLPESEAEAALCSAFVRFHKPRLSQVSKRTSLDTALIHSVQAPLNQDSCQAWALPAGVNKKSLGEPER